MYLDIHYYRILTLYLRLNTQFMNKIVLDS